MRRECLGSGVGQRPGHLRQRSGAGRTEERNGAASGRTLAATLRGRISLTPERNGEFPETTLRRCAPRAEVGDDSALAGASGGSGSRLEESGAAAPRDDPAGARPQAGRRSDLAKADLGVDPERAPVGRCTNPPADGHRARTGSMVPWPGQHASLKRGFVRPLGGPTQSFPTTTPSLPTERCTRGWSGLSCPHVRAVV